MANQFGDLPQIPGFVDETHWGPSPLRYIHGSMQYYGRPVPDEGIMYNDSFGNGMGSMQPMQRFLVDQSHYQPGMLHAKYDYTGPHPSQVSVHYEPMYPSIEGFRDASPDCTSISGTSSHATQNESRSPHPYHSVPYGSPKDFSQSSHPYPTVDHFNETPYLAEVPISGGSVSLRELEYEHYEPEATIEEPECVEIKADAVYDHDSNIKINIAAKNYADSGIGNSVRDAESVQPIEPSEEPSSDSDYTPTRTSKRRRSSTSNNTAARNGQRRRGHGRNNSSAGLANGNSSRVTKKTRGTFNPTKANSDSNILTSGQRPFQCPLAPYNCKSTFSSKNEWKRHVSTQHIKLGFWRCDLCAPSVDPNDESTAYYNDFNRKDLFTQHLRRMHTAPTNSLSRNQREYVVTEDNLHEHQKRCYQFLRETPQLSACLFCERTFSGPNSWEERMEHVGRHLEKDRKNGVDLLNITTWNHDKTLENYLLEEGLIILEHGKWAIGDGKPRGHSDVNSDEESEQDE